MLTVTEGASAQLADMLTAAEAPDDVAVRFVVQGQGLALGLDQVKAEDQTFEHSGKTVLVLDEEIAGLLNDKTLDVEDTDEGPRLALK
jgi:Fe-S cluster assembly iron-binding protein IscA